MKQPKQWAIGLIMLTAEQTESAQANGLSRHAVYVRISDLQWEVERAITTPVQHKVKLNYTKADLQQAEANGIPRSTFVSRVKRNWDLKRACTEPPAKRGKHIG